MNLLHAIEADDIDTAGQELFGMATELYPVCRSLTGEGVRKTLARIGRGLPLESVSVPSGTRVFDWTVPKEWNVRDAYISRRGGERLVDFRKSNLHVVSYSVPVRTTLTLDELRPHLFTLPESPEWIPYRTSYYEPRWGFCLTHKDFLRLEQGEYDVFIDSSLTDGHLTYGECFLPGESENEVLISCHVCHPSLANDNLSGIVVATRLAELVSLQPRHYSYRFLFVPGTIGAITWLANNRERAQRIQHGLVLTGIGDRGGFHYKKSRRGNAEIDRAAAHVLKHCGEPSQILEFSPYGYDERQYCSPGFNLPVGCLMRSVWGTFPEYHTSADNLDFIQPGQLARSLRACGTILDVLEGNRRYVSLNPFCEPQLGRRNLYRSVGGDKPTREMALLWVLNLSDGENSLLDIAERSDMPFSSIADAADQLYASGLLDHADHEGRRTEHS